MIKLPIIYCNTALGHAKTDDEMEFLQNAGVTLLCRIPNRVRTIADRRPDVIAALLREDLQLRQSLKPFFLIAGKQVYLSHCVVNVRVRRAVKRFLESTDFERQETDLIEDLHTEIRDAVKSVKRVVYLNGDRTDCRVENVRQVLDGPVVEEDVQLH